MKKLNDNDLYQLIRIIPLVLLSYFQFLSWEQGKWWSILQWSSIITSTVALIIFAAHIVEITNINKISKYKSYQKGARKLIEITNFIFERYDINYVSAFALSKHNFKRGSVLIDIIKNVVVTKNVKRKKTASASKIALTKV